jgi:hypothetical protein
MTAHMFTGWNQLKVSPKQIRRCLIRVHSCHVPNTIVVPRVLQCLSPHLNLDPPPPLRKRVCPPPTKGGGETHSPAGEGVGEVPIRTTGEKSLLCVSCLNAFNVFHHLSLYTRSCNLGIYFYFYLTLFFHFLYYNHYQHRHIHHRRYCARCKIFCVHIPAARLIHINLLKLR